MKVPFSAEDNCIPMEIEDHVPLFELHRRRNEHWARLKRARIDCPDSEIYPAWLEQTHGLQVHLVDGMISDEYTVVNDPKYIMYLLKFG
jgi:hypothetical protein